MRLFKRSEKEDLFKQQQKITKKLLKKIKKYRFRKDYTEEELSELIDKAKESTIKEQEIKKEKINRVLLGGDIYKMMQLKIEELLKQEDFKNLLEKVGEEWFNFFECGLEQLKLDIVYLKKKVDKNA